MRNSIYLIMIIFSSELFSCACDEMQPEVEQTFEIAPLASAWFHVGAFNLTKEESLESFGTAISRHTAYGDSVLIRNSKGESVHLGTKGFGPVYTFALKRDDIKCLDVKETSYKLLSKNGLGLGLNSTRNEIDSFFGVETKRNIIKFENSRELMDESHNIMFDLYQYVEIYFVDDKVTYMSVGLSKSY